MYLVNCLPRHHLQSRVEFADVKLGHATLGHVTVRYGRTAERRVVSGGGAYLTGARSAT